MILRQFTKPYLLLAVILLCVFLTSCNDNGARYTSSADNRQSTQRYRTSDAADHKKSPVDDQEITSLNFNQMTDEQILMLVNYVPLGLYYSDVKALIPSLSELDESEDLGEASAKVFVLGYDADLEFDFSHSKLYSLGLSIRFEDCVKANLLFTRLQNFYSIFYGNPEADQEGSSSGYFNFVGRYWCDDGMGIVLGNNIYGNNLYGTKCVVGWGFQNGCP